MSVFNIYSSPANPPFGPLVDSPWDVTNTVPLTYPSSILDQATAFLSLLGSFWSQIFSETSGLYGYVAGSLELNWQTYINYLETIATLSRFTVPVFHENLWGFTTLYLSELNNAQVDPITYGSGLTYGQTGIFYGGTVVIPTFRFAIPTNIVDAMQIVDVPIKPNVMLIDGVDYTINSDKHYVEFLANPFTSGQFNAVTTTNPKTGLQDQAINIWFFKSSIDLQNVYLYFGYILGIYINKSSYNYKLLINSLFDSMILGPSMKTLTQIIACVTGIPVVKTPQEVVQVIITNDTRHLQIITDKNVYTYLPTCTPSVVVGQTVYGGDQLVTAVVIRDVNDYEDAISGVTGITIDGSTCSLPLSAPLVFQNGSYPTTYTTDAYGNAVVTFTGITGAASDITLFWNHAYAQGVATGHSVAQSLRINQGYTNQPPASEIPSNVNPMVYLLTSILIANLTLVNIDCSAINNGLGLSALQYIRRALPPHSTVYFFLRNLPS